ncbi:hypothetical protein [Streptomyces sp. NPDC007172]|uniref:hypothetical protein n=1 Tax=Streptomyces sp. NPDC007172 TaxID=3364776 RepID=UPI0036C1EF41
MAGQKIPRGKKIYVAWAPSQPTGFTSQDSTWFTAPDSGIYVLSSTLSVGTTATAANGDGVVLYVDRRAVNGTIAPVATVRELALQASVQVVSVCTVVHLRAGEAVAVASYLDSGSPNPAYAIQGGEWECHLSALMVGPGAASFTEAPSPTGSLADWADQAVITAADMTARITTPLRTLYSPARILTRVVGPYASASGQRMLIPWGSATMEECGGWRMSGDGTTFTVPRSGIYLVTAFTGVQRDGTQGPYGSYQVNLLRNGQPFAVRQRQNTRLNYSTAIPHSEVLFLAAGDTVSTELMGTGTGLTWRPEPSNDGWHAFGAVMLGPTAISMKG